MTYRLTQIFSVLGIAALWGFGVMHENCLAQTQPNIVLLLADNWAYPHAGIYGDSVLKTPTFDALAKQGVCFTRAYAPFPSCSPSRAAMLTGRVTHQLEDAANLYGALKAKFPAYPDLLEEAGYFVGAVGKPWAPAPNDPGERKRNPSGPPFKTIQAFLDNVPRGKPFSLWFGSHHPHVPWTENQARKREMDAAAVKVPSHLPDHPEVREDILSYYCEVEAFDRECGEILEELRRRGLLDNTLIVMSSDNGWQLPRGLANCYESGTHVPLALSWPGQVKRGLNSDSFVTVTDLAPTFLEAAGLPPLPAMTGISMLPLARGETQAGREAVFVERERHANVRKGDLSYPIRGIRTRDFLYLHNLRPDRWPAGDPEAYFAVGPFGDIDPSKTKELIQNASPDSPLMRYFKLCFDIRPAEELYDVKKDPDQTVNLAGNSRYAGVLNELRRRTSEWMKRTGDPRATHDDNAWDRVPYDGPPAKSRYSLEVCRETLFSHPWLSRYFSILAFRILISYGEFPARLAYCQEEEKVGF